MYLVYVFTIIPFILVSSVFAETFVNIPFGTSVPGCEETNECFIPIEISVGVGETVTWSNADTAAHTITSGSSIKGPNGIFDSSIFMAETTFSHTFDEAGTYKYFCMVHPWMVGIVIVGDVGSTPEPIIHEIDPIIQELLNENAQLKLQVQSLQNQVLELKNQIENLNALVLEQIKVIYEWVISR